MTRDPPLRDWQAVAAHALSLPGTEPGTSYGAPAVKVAANGRAFVHLGHEADTSFVLAADRDTVERWLETDPATFWQTPHYVGWPAVLARFDSPDPERVRDAIAAARDWNATRSKVRPRPVERG